MNWPFWSLSRPAHSESCEDIEPLLSLYADGMASPEEVRQVEAHLPGCDDCREALSWMQATHRTLAARPIAIPPADLHSRIAQAIAASSAAPITLRPARTFALRTSYLAAASLTALGIVLTYSWMLSPAKVMVKHSSKLISIATVPAGKSAPKSNVRMAHLPHAVHVQQTHPIVASNSPASDNDKPIAVEHTPIVKKVPLKSRMEQNQVAENVLAPHLTPTIVGPTRIVTPHTQMANSKEAAAEKHLPASVKENLTPIQPETAKIADREGLTPQVPVHILPSTVTEQPAVKTASGSSQSPPKLRDAILGVVVARTKQMAATALQPIPVLYHGTATAMQSLDSEHAPHVYSPIYSDTASK